MKTSGNPSLLKITLLMLMFVSYSDTYVFSKPRGGQVVSGTASFTQDGNLTVITAGNRSIINYTGFDIAKGEIVQFVQPSAHSTVLNRVTTDNPTNIFGTLQANGIVVIANPYGVFFQNGSVVNVGGLIAGAGQVSAAEFTKGKVHFTDLNGDVRNDGVIAADNRIALMGANVVNTGSMTVAHGAAMMVSGQDVYVGDKNGNIFVQANGKSLKAAAASSAAGASAGSVTNSGTVAAPRVLLGAGDMYSTAIVNSGLLQGRSIAVNAGKNGSATVGGTLDASSAHTPTATGKGGRIDVTGGTVALKGATLDASGDTGGGSVRVGGDFHGDGALAHAATTAVDAATTIKADATGATGNGGTVVLWSDTGTIFSGNISANAGSAGGDGGQVEVSSHGGLGFTGNVLANAPSGKVGSLLLDPANIEIVTGTGANDTEFTLGSLLTTPPNPPGTITAAQGSGTYTISQGALQGLASNINISLSATQDIHIDKLTGSTLTFAAPTVLGNGSITFSAGSGGTTGSFAMDPNDTIVTNGRALTITAAGTGSGGINTGTYADAPTVNIANFGILAGTINTSPGGTATAGGAVTFNSTVATGTAPAFPVQATSVVTSSGGAAGGTITIGPATGAFSPTSITVNGPLTTTAGGTANGGNVLFTSSGLQNIGAVNTTSAAARGGNVVLNGGGITTTDVTTTGAGAAGANGGGGNVTLTSTGAVNVNGALTATSTGGGSTGGNVNLTAGGLIGVTGLIDTRVAAGAGTGGNVTILTKPTGSAGGDTLAGINTSTSGTANAGNILIGTDGTTAFVPASLTLNGALTATALGTAGNGGAINLRSNGAILANATTSTLNASSTAATGGAITVINSGNSVTFNGAVNSNGPTGGGNVTMDGGGLLSLATVDTSSTGAKGGNIILGLTAPFTNITINSGGTAASNSLLATGTTATAGAAAGGNVTLASSGTISVTGAINTAALGGSADVGNGGTVSVLTNQSGTPGADVLGAITTAATGTGNAGSIFLGQNGTSIFAPASLTLNGALTANAAGPGSGGTVGLAAAGLLSEASAIDTSVLSGAGNGGSVTILTVPSGSAGGDTLGSITTTTQGTGNAGNILIGTNVTNGATMFAPANLTLNGPLAAAATGTAGTGGAVTLVATGTIGGTSGAISTTSLAANAGSITATSTGGGVTLGSLTSTAAGAGNGGAVTLTAHGALTVGAINTSTSGTGTGGAVGVYSNATSATPATPFSLAGINTSSNTGVGGKITVGNLVAPAFGPTSLTLNGGLATTGGAIDLETNAATGTITFIVAASPFRVTLTGDTTLVGASLAISDGAATHPFNFDLTNHNLTLNLSGGMTVDGAVNGTTGKFDNVNSFFTSGTGVTTIDASFSTNGSQTYGSVYETLSATATLQAGTSDATGGINFNAPLYDQTPGTHGLTLMTGVSSGGVTINQAIGGTLSGTASPLASLTATTYTGGGTEKVTINGVTITTTGSQSYGTLTLGVTTGPLITLTSTGGTGAITSGTVTGATHPLTVNTAGSGSSSTFAAINNAGAVDFEVGGIANFNGAITATSFTLGATNPGTRGIFTVTGGGNTVATTGGQTYNEEVYLGAATTLADTGTTSTINLKGVDSASATAQTLTVNTPGLTVFGGAVGAINPLASLTTDKETPTDRGTQINGATVTTNGAAGQVYNDAVTLGANTTLTAGAGVVTFGSSLESLGAARSLAISTSGATTFGGEVGGALNGSGVPTVTTGAPALASLSITGGGVVNVNGGSVTTVTTPGGVQTYGTTATPDQVVLGANTIFTGYSATFTGGITETTAGTYNLTLNLASRVTLPGTGMLLNNIKDFASIGDGGVLINGDVTTYGSQTYSGAAYNSTAGTGGVLIGGTAGSTITLHAGNGTTPGVIIFNTTVDDQTAGSHNLVLQAGQAGFVAINSAIGSVNPLASLTATTGITPGFANTVEPVTIKATSVTTTGLQAYGTLTLGGTGLTTLGGSSITSGAVTGGGNPLTVNATSSTNFGAITGAGALNFNVSGTATFASINDPAASVTTTLGSAVFGPVTATGVSVGGAGTATFNGTVNATDVSVTETGATAFNGAVNATSLTVSGGTGVTLNAGTITTTGEQNYNEPATLGALETLSGQGTVANGGIAVRFGSTLSGPFRLVLNNVTGTGGATSNTIFGGAVGTLASLSTSTVGTTQINGGSVATSDATLGQVYNGATTLGATTTLSAGTGPINFATAGSTLNSAGTPRALTISTGGLTTFNAQVGGTLSLASLLTSTGEVDIKAGVNTLTTVGGFQNYGGSVHLTGDTTLQGYSLALNGGLVGQGNSLTLNFTTQIGVPGGMTGLNNFTTVGAGGALVSGAFGTGGTQTYSGGPVVLGAASTLTSTNGGLIFNTPVDGAFGLTLNANGAGGQAIFNAGALVGNGTANGIGTFTSNTASGTIFNMNAGGSTSGKGGLNAASVTVTGPVTFNEAGSTLTATTHPSVLTTGTQTYSGAATLAQDTSLVSSGGGAIAFNAAAATVDSASATLHALNTSTTGTQTFSGLIGAGFGLSGLTTGSGPTVFNMAISSTNPAVVPAGVRVVGPVTTAGPVTFNVANSTLAQPSVLTLGSGTQTYGTLASPTATVVTLAGPVTVLNSASTESPAGTFNGGGTIVFNGNIVATAVAPEFDVRAGTGTVEFDSAIYTTGDFAPGGASVVFRGTIGTAANPLGVFTVLPNNGGTGTPLIDLNGQLVVTGGTQTYNFPVVLSAPTTLTAGTAGGTVRNITFGSTLDGSNLLNNNPYALTINLNGGILAFNGIVGGTVPLASLAINNIGATLGTTQFNMVLPTLASGLGGVNVLGAVTVNTNADFEATGSTAPTILSGVTYNGVTGTGTQTYGATGSAAAVTVGTNTVLRDLATAGGITFNGKIDAKTDGGTSLSVNAVGDESFNQLVGSTQRLSSLTTDAVGTVGGSTRFNMDLTQAGAVAGVRTTGAVNVNDQVVFNATGGTTLPTILSGGAQNFQLAATLNTDAVLTATSGDITFFGAVDSVSAAAPRALTVSTPGDEIFHGLVGYTTALSSLTTDATGTVGGEAQFLMTRPSNTPGGSTAGGVNVTGNVAVNDGVFFQVGNTLNTTPFQPSVSSGGSQTYVGPATLSTQTILTSTGGNVAFNSTVDSETLAAPQNLTISTTAGHTTTFAQAVGNTFPLATLHTTGGGTAQINGGLVKTANSQLYDNAVTIGQDTILTSAGTTDNIVFGSSLDGTHSLTVNGANTVSFAAVGNTAPLLNLTVTAPNGTTFNYTPSLVTAGNADVNIAGALAVNGPVFFNAAGAGNVMFVRTGVMVAGLTPTPASGQDYSGLFTLSGTATFTDLNSGGITFHAGVNGASSPAVSNLTVSTGGAIRFLGAVGATPLTSLTTSNLGFATGRTVISGGSVATTGAQTYNDAVFIDNTAATLTSNNTGDITFALTLDSLTASAQALTVNTAGQTVFGGAVGTAHPLASLTTDAAGATQINGGSVTTTGAQIYNDSATLGAAGQATTLTSNAGGDIMFAGTLDSNTAATPQALTVDTAGRTVFGAAVGMTYALASLTTDKETPTDQGTFINGGSVTTINTGAAGVTGAQTYNDAVTLGNNTILRSNVGGTATAGGAITFNGTVDGGFTLAVNTGGLTAFNQPVGNRTALTALTTNAAGSTQFNMPVGTLAGVVVAGPVTINDPVTFSVTGATLALPTILTLANGSQTYGGAVTLTKSTDLVSAAAVGTGGVYTGGSSVFFNSVNGISGTGDLYVRTGSGDGSIAGPINAASVDINGGFVNFAGPTNISGNLSIASNAGVSSTLTFTGGTITTSGAQSYESAFILGSSAVLTSANGNITFNNRVDGKVDGAYDLTANTPGDETFNGPVGASGALRSLATDAAGQVGGRVIFGYAGTTTAPSVTTVNDQVYHDAALLGANTALASRSGNITFAQTVDSASGGTFALFLNAAGNETFNGRVGGTGTLASLVTDDANGTISGGQVIFNVAGGGQTVTTTGAQTYNDAVVLQADTNLTSVNNGALTFASTIDGVFALSLNTTGVTKFGGVVGGGANTALTSLTTSTGEVDINGGAITTSGVQSYGGPVVLGAGTTLTSTAAAGGLTFNSTLDSGSAADSPYALTISSVGPTKFNGVVGGNGPLASLTTQGAGVVQINGGAVTTTGVQKYSGAVILGADTTLTSTAATGGGITFVSTLGSDAAATPRALTINSVGPTKFNGVVGGNNLPLASLTTIQGAGLVQINGGAITTTGEQSYGGPVTLGANTTLTSTANTAQAIVFNNTVDSDASAPGSTLTIGANGDEVFGGLVGSIGALGSLTTTNTGRVVFGINGVPTGVKTTGAQTYGNPVVLAADTTLSSTTAGGGVTFASTVGSESAALRGGLIIGSVGPTIFADVVGGNNLPLFSLTTQGKGTVQINGGAVTTTGLQSYGGAVTLGKSDTTLTSTDGGNITFSSTLDGGKGVGKNAVFNLTLNTSGDEVFNGLVGSNRELTNLTTDSDSANRGGRTRFNMALSGSQNGVDVINNIVINDEVVFATTGATTAATILSGGSQTYKDAATVNTDTVLTDTAGSTGNAITFSSTINGPAGLTLNSHGATAFNGAIGTGKGGPLGSLTVTADGNGAILFNGGGATTSGAQSYARQVILGADATFAITGTSAANDITFAQGIAGSSFTLGLSTANLNDSTVFEDSVDVQTLKAADGSAVVLAGGNVTTHGLQTYGGTLIVTAPGTADNLTVLTDDGTQPATGIIFKQAVTVQAGSLVALGNRILAGRESNFAVNAGDLVLDARDRLVLQGDSYTATGRVILNDPADSVYSYASYANQDTIHRTATIYVLNSGRTTTFRGSGFDMGYLQNLFALGSVSITAVGGGNATLSDISTVGSLSVAAGSITLRARNADPSRGDGTDDGLNFVSGGSINFGQSPINYTSDTSATNNHANLVTSGGQVTVNRNQVNGISLFQDPTVRSRLATAQDTNFTFDGDNVQDLGSFGSFSELISSGSKSQEIAAALSGALPDQKPGTDVTDNLTVTASQMEELKKLGIHPRVAQKQERLSLNSKRALFAQLVDGLDTDNYGRLQPVKGGISRLVPSDYVVVVDRMSEREVQSILTAFYELYGKTKEKAQPIGESFNTAFTDYATEKQTADPAGFSPYISSKPGKYPEVDKAVRGFDNLFGYIESLGLTPKEQQKSKEHIASDLQVSGVSPEDMVKVIDTLRAKIPKEQKAPSTKLPPSPPASNPAPGATNPPPPEQKKGTPPLKTARQGQKDSGRKTARQHQLAATEDRLHEVAGL